MINPLTISGILRVAVAVAAPSSPSQVIDLEEVRVTTKDMEVEV